MTLPFVFMLLDFWPLDRLGLARPPETGPMRQSPGRRGEERAATGRGTWLSSNVRRAALRLLAEKIPFFAVSVAFSAIAMAAQSRVGALRDFEQYPFSERCMNAAYVYMAYLGKAVDPQNLAIYYPYPHGTLDRNMVALAAACLVAITGASVLWIRRYPFFFVGWSWYLGTLVPVIGLVQIGSQQMADRYTYFPLIGIFLAVAWLVPEFVPGGVLRTRLLPAAALGVIVLAMAMAFRQASLWRDNATLFRHSENCTPDNFWIHQLLGSDLLVQGNRREGLAELKRAVQLAPSSPSGIAPWESDCSRWAAWMRRPSNTRRRFHSRSRMRTSIATLESFSSSVIDISPRNEICAGRSNLNRPM